MTDPTLVTDIGHNSEPGDLWLQLWDLASSFLADPQPEAVILALLKAIHQGVPSAQAWVLRPDLTWLTLDPAGHFLRVPLQSGISSGFSDLVEHVRQTRRPGCSRSHQWAAPLDAKGGSVLVIEKDGSAEGITPTERQWLSAICSQVWMVLPEENNSITEKRYQAIVEAQVDFLSRYTPEGCYTFINPSFCRLLGQEAADLLGQNWIEARPAQAQERIRADISSLTPDQPRGKSVEITYTDPHGQIHWIEWIDQGIFDRTGTLIEVQSVGRDITARKRTELALAGSEQQLRILVDHLPFPVWMRDSHHRLVLQNAADRACYGDLIGTTPNDMTLPDPIKAEWNQELEALKSGHTLRGETTLGSGSEGRSYLYTNTSVPDGQGGVGSLGIWIDITERKQMEEALRASEERYRLLAEVSPVGIFRNDRQGHCIYANAKTLEITGLTLEENLGEGGWTTHLHPEDQAWIKASWAHFVEQVNLGQEAEYRVEPRYCYPDGGVKWILAQAVPERNTAGELVGFIGSLIDITERKLAEAAMRLRESQLSAFVEHTPLSVAMFDRQMNYIVASRDWISDYNLTAESLVGKNHYDIVPNISDEWKKAHQLGLSGFVQQSERDHYLRLDGTLEVIRWKVQPWYLAPESIGGIIIYSEVITDRVETEMALQLSEERLQALVNALPFELLVLDVNDRLILQNTADINRNGSQIGASIEDLSGISTERIERYYVTKKICFENPTFQDRFESTEVVNGEERTYLRLSTALPEKGGSIGLFGVGIDITDQKQIEASLRVSEERFNTLLNALPFEVWARDSQDVLIIQNTVNKKRFGDQLGTSLELLDLPEDLISFYRKVKQEKEPGEFVQRETIEQIGDLNHSFIRIIGSFPDSDKSKGVFGVNIDITEQKRIQEALRVSEVKQRALIQALPDLVMLVNSAGVYLDFYSTDIFHVIGNRDLIVGTQIEDHLPSRQAKQRRQAIYLALQTGEVQIYEQEFMIDGRLQIEECRVAKCGEDEVLIVSRDITERKRSEVERKRVERALRESQSSLLEAQRIAHIGSWEFDLPTQTISWSEELYRMFGLDPALPVPPFEEYLRLIHPDDRIPLQQCIQEAIQNGTPYKTDLRIICPDGSIRIHEGRGEVVRNDVGTVVKLRGTALDITERKHAEFQIRHREQQLRLTLEFTGIGVWSWIPSKGTYEWNGKMEELLEIPPGLANMFQLWTDRIDTEDVDRVTRNIQNALAHQTPFAEEYRYQLLSGRKVWRWVRGQGIYSEKGQLERVLGVVQDIDDRKRAEADLQESERRYVSLTEVAPVGIFRFDIQGQCVYVNSRWSEMTGRPIEWAEGTGWVNTLHPEDRQRIPEEWNVAFTQHGGVYRGEGRFLQPNGTEVWFDVQVSPETNGVGSLIGYVGTLTDISDRKRAESAVKFSEERLKTLINALPFGVWLRNADDRVVLQNTIDIARHGDILGSHISQLGGLAELRDQYYQIKESMAFGKTHTFEFKETINEEERYFYRITAPLPDTQGGRGMFGVSIDITDRKRAEIDLQNLNEELEKRVQVRTQELEESRNMLQLVLDTIPQRVFWKDLDSRYLGCNPVFAQDHQVSREYCIGKTDQEIIPWPEFVDFYYKEDAEVIATQKPFLNEETIKPLANGQILWTRTSKIPLTNSKGEVVGILGYYEDITDQKIADQQLQSERLRLQVALEAAEMGTWESNLDTGYWSPQTEAIFGYAPGQFPGDRESFLKLIYQEDQERVFQALLHSFSTQAPYNIEYRINRLDGELRWVAVKGIVVESKDELGLKIVGVAQDITQRKQSEQALQISEERLRLALSAANQGFYDLNLSTRNVVTSPEYAMMLGYDPDEFSESKESWIQSLHPDDRERVSDVYRKYVNGELAEYKVEFRQKIKQGGWKWILSLGKIVEWDDQGQPLRMLGTHTDIDERKKAENDLAQRTAILQSVIESTPDVVFVKDSEGRIVLANSTFVKFLGQPLEALLGKSDTDLWPPEMASQLRELDLSIMSAGVSVTMEDSVPHPDGIKTYLTTKSPWYDSQGQVVGTVGLSRDISERKQAEQALRQFNQELEQRVEIRTAELRVASDVAIQAATEAEAANRAKSLFLANMSHELRTPLNGILGFCQLLQRSSLLPAEHQNDVKTIRRSGEHLLNLINDVLDMSKLEAGNITLHERPFDLYRLLDDVEAMFKPIAHHKSVELRIHISAHTPQFLLSDEVKLRQVLINLLSNAVKFTAKGSVTLSVEEEEDPKLNPTHCRLRFSVKDTGEGIAPSEMKVLFKAFGQTQSGRTSQQGTGLGLAISQKYVQLMGGEIRVSSQVNEGSHFGFSLNLPKSESSQVNPLSSKGEVVALEPNQPHYRILVVDDREHNRQIVCRLLRPLGFEVQEAVDGGQALTQWRVWQPHLIWMDLRMAGLDGYETTRRIRHQEFAHPSERTVIIALTATSSEADRAKALSAGCDDFASKPLQESELFSLMEQHLGVRFVYHHASEDRSPSHSVPPPAQLSTALGSPNSEWLAQLEQAVTEGDSKSMHELVTKLDPTFHHLASQLLQLIQGFNYEEILSWIAAQQHGCSRIHEVPFH